LLPWPQVGPKMYLMVITKSKRSSGLFVASERAYRAGRFLRSGLLMAAKLRAQKVGR